MIDYRLYLVTDEPSRYAGDWLENVVAAVQGGVTCVQYRDTQSNGKLQYARLLALTDALRPYKTPIVVNNDLGLALAVGAAAVHVGQGDMPPSAIRPVAGSRLEIGYSITHLTQISQCADEIAVSDCLGIGPVYDATRTKADAAPEMGIGGLREILDEIGEKPNVAIGGITLERLPGLVRAGVGGVAVVSAFSQAADPYEVARKMRSFF